MIEQTCEGCQQLVPEGRSVCPSCGQLQAATRTAPPSPATSPPTAPAGRPDQPIGVPGAGPIGAAPSTFAGGQPPFGGAPSFTTAAPQPPQTKKRKSSAGSIVKAVIGGAFAIAVFVASVVLLVKGDDDDGGAAKAATPVVDKSTGINWTMPDTPEVDKGTLKINTLRSGDHIPDAPRRAYETDEGGWVERVVVIDTAPGTLSLEAAVTVSASSDAYASYDNLKHVTIAGQPAVTATHSEIGTDGGSMATMFAVRVGGSIVTGSIIDTGTIEDLDQQFKDLTSSISA